ncbi:acylneuraminate cytidylyltransferase family protein [Anaerofilum sp. BX8]|uniref:Acylneuraminate cytidylyltransferase family protein n=1 Tax=Anaerofilum hominis TaxID=2763016 RepID=A0A923I5D8_9FIRM|nr:acylneuraminate cytidylyltransferase family protein [Anaerofilum hominis]MBC5580636.1 acylneuraminate cytidylyltransferase family protein [Anaerofilum hominis]
MKRVLITVCGRAGSKGFRNKNLKVFCGQPLVYYTLSAAELFRRARPDLSVEVALNTDSPELRALTAQRYPEAVPVKRPQELCGDTVPKMAVFQQTLAEMERRGGCRYDYLIDLDITSPIRREGDVAGAFAAAEAREDLDLVFSVAEARRNPYFNMVKVVGDHVEKVIESPYTARQQAPAIYDLNASIYVFRRDFLAENRTGILWDGKCGIYEMFDSGILDIDSEADYRLMEVVARHLYDTAPEFAAVRENIRG